MIMNLMILKNNQNKLNKYRFNMWPKKMKMLKKYNN